MNYFSFSEIAKGVIALIFLGFFAALCIESMRLLLLCKNAFLSLPGHLYQNRNRFLGRAFVFKKRNLSLFDSAVLDFLSVITLFVLYILASYLCFDGIFRIIYLAPLLVLYFLTKNYFLRPYSYICARFIFLLCRLSCRCIAPIVYIWNVLICVIKLPIKGIISWGHFLCLCFLSRQRMRVSLKSMRNSYDKMLA